MKTGNMKVLAITILLGASASVFAQPALTTERAAADIRGLRGDAPDYPRVGNTMAPGTGRPMIREFHEGRGDMPDHPHVRPTPGRSGPLQQTTLLPAGDMPSYPLPN